MKPAPGRRTGLQTEVLFSLGAVMILATVVLTAVLVLHSEARLRDLLGRALLAEARSPAALSRSLVPGTTWWNVKLGGAVTPRGVVTRAIDAESRALGLDALASGTPLLRPGALWEPIRFAVVDRRGHTAKVARLPRAASLQMRTAPLLVALGVLAADAVIFTAFGAYLLRRRVVLPLRRLAVGARAIADGDEGARVPLEGTREACEVATAFNDMTVALEGRTQALEKAVVDLRTTNRSLRDARAGLDRAQRLAAVGRLAAGVAHEVGNPIGAMLTFLELARRDPGIAPASRDHLERAGREGDRVRRILRQLLDFSRPPRAESIPFDLASVVRETVALVAAAPSAQGIEFRIEEEGSLPSALGDPSATSQILLNLLLNAAHAVRDVPEPAIGVTLRPTILEVRAGEIRGPRSGRAPDALECSVSDNGTGVQEEDVERLFDPFFTTKQPGEGTGLGLSNALRLAEELGGTIEFAPGREMGAEFLFRLRVSPGSEPLARGESAANPFALRTQVRSRGSREASENS